MPRIELIKKTSYKITLDQEEYEYLRFIFNKFYESPLDWPQEGGVHRMNLWEIFNQFNEIPIPGPPTIRTKDEKAMRNLVVNPPDSDFDYEFDPWKKSND